MELVPLVSQFESGRAFGSPVEPAFFFGFGLTNSSGFCFVAIFMISTALEVELTGRFSPFGPVGMTASST